MTCTCQQKPKTKKRRTSKANRKKAITKKRARR